MEDVAQKMVEIGWTLVKWITIPIVIIYLVVRKLLAWRRDRK